MTDIDDLFEHMVPHLIAAVISTIVAISTLATVAQVVDNTGIGTAVVTSVLTNLLRPVRAFVQDFVKTTGNGAKAALNFVGVPTVIRTPSQKSRAEAEGGGTSSAGVRPRPSLTPQPSLKPSHPPGTGINSPSYDCITDTPFYGNEDIIFKLTFTSKNISKEYGCYSQIINQDRGPDTIDKRIDLTEYGEIYDIHCVLSYKLKNINTDGYVYPYINNIYQGDSSGKPFRLKRSNSDKYKIHNSPGFNIPILSYSTPKGTRKPITMIYFRFVKEADKKYENDIKITS